MAKVVFLRVYQGDFNKGFNVILQIGYEGQICHTSVDGYLPPAPEVHRYYQNWQPIYRGLGQSQRLESPPEEVTNCGDAYQNCRNAANLLSESLNNWLNSNEFRLVRERLLENLSKSDEVRVILQVDDILMRLPWHLWDFFERYPKAEIALGTQNFTRLDTRRIPAASKVRILAILGNSSGIDIEKDRALLERLSNAEVQFLVEPERSEISEHLWEKNWDILFFAGHSGTDGITGNIYINPNDSLNIDELKNGLKKAIEGGLQLAIFNSGDGLGLAQQLAELQIPQVIVMREAIPDKVAQEFLKFFLGFFSKGKSLYLSVRNTRQTLEEELEQEYPCASWLPVIFQHPAAVPFVWRESKAHVFGGCTITILMMFLCIILVLLLIILITTEYKIQPSHDVVTWTRTINCSDQHIWNNLIGGAAAVVGLLLGGPVGALTAYATVTGSLETLTNISGC